MFAPRLDAMRVSALVFVLLGAVPVDAQVVRGRLLDDATGRHVAGAEVVLRDAAQRAVARATADSIGVFQLSARHAGPYTIGVTHIGYLAYTSEPVPLHRNEMAHVTVRLSTMAIPLQPLVVNARRVLAAGKLADFERRRAQAFGHFLTRADIERRPVATATTLLRTTPGVVLQRVSRNGAMDGSERHVIQFQGTRLQPCVANVYVDGVRVQQDEHTVDDWLDPELIAGVEVYARGVTAPLEYRGGDCGVVLFWTRAGERSTRSGTLRYVAAGAAALATVAAFFLVR